MANASRSKRPTPTSRRASPSSSAGTTRATSSPLISAQEDPLLDHDLEPDVDEQRPEQLGGRGRRDPLRCRCRLDRTQVRAPRPATPRAGAANGPARRARVAATSASSASRCSSPTDCWRAHASAAPSRRAPSGPTRTQPCSPAANVAPSGNPPGRPSTSDHRPRTSAASLAPNRAARWSASMGPVPGTTSSTCAGRSAARSGRCGRRCPPASAARVEGVALVAELDRQRGHRRAGGERVAAGAAHLRLDVVGVDVGLHRAPVWRSSCTGYNPGLFRVGRIRPVIRPASAPSRSR